MWREPAKGFEFLAEAGFTNGRVGRKHDENILLQMPEYLIGSSVFIDLDLKMVETWMHP